VGDIVEFGGYEWRVLDVSGGKTLLLCESVLERRAYHGESIDITWAECDLRAYLNGEFYDKFSADDKARIALTRNSNKDNQWFGTSGGSDTDDYIFNLSVEEVVKYFGDSGQLSKRPERNPNEIDDQYNEARKAYRTNGDVSQWWLRSPGYFTSGAANIGKDGNIEFVSGCGVTNRDPRIRPAMWVNP
jgi:hypothetical protein